MGKEIFVRAKSDGKIYKANASNLDLEPKDQIIFESEQGQEVAMVVTAFSAENSEKAEEAVTIIRKLTDKDKEKCLERKGEAKETLSLCQEKIKKHGLTMDLLDADLSYDGKKLTFYFSAPGRIDFRALVPDLASTFKKLIRLQQVGSRDKAKCVKGVGRCGQKICCQFLKGDLEDVNIEMANEQNLGQTGANRVTGVCGKLMCCLKYELDAYKTAKKKMPAVGSEYKTPEGLGIVLFQNIMKNKITVELKKDKRIVEADC